MDWKAPYELKHLHGIPYYVQSGIAYTFELRDNPVPGIAMGTYDSTHDSLTYYPDWRERSQSRLDAFREGLQLVERANIRQAIVKPQKSRHPKRASRKRTPKRAEVSEDS